MQDRRNHSLAPLTSSDALIDESFIDGIYACIKMYSLIASQLHSFSAIISITFLVSHIHNTSSKLRHLNYFKYAGVSPKLKNHAQIGALLHRDRVLEGRLRRSSSGPKFSQFSIASVGARPVTPMRMLIQPFLW